MELKDDDAICVPSYIPRVIRQGDKSCALDKVSIQCPNDTIGIDKKRLNRMSVANDQYTNEKPYDGKNSESNNDETSSIKESVQKIRKQIGAAVKIIREKQLLTADSLKPPGKYPDEEVKDKETCHEMSDGLQVLFDTITNVKHSLDDVSSHLEHVETTNGNSHDDTKPPPVYRNSLITGEIKNINEIIYNMVPIGHGGEGRVFRGKLKTTGQLVVVKSYFMDCEQSSRIEYAMLVLAHNVRGVKRPIGLINTSSSFFLIVEDDHNSVPLDVIIDQTTLTETQIQCIFSQMAHILYDLKKKLIKHRDIKLDNFLLNTKNGRLSIIDFGWAMYSAIDWVSIGEIKRSGETLMGTFDYLPPEHESPDGTLVSYEKATVFALGCILIELFFGYQGRIRIVIAENGIISFLNKVSKTTGVNISKGAISLIDRCTKINPQNRLSLEGILLHPWVPSDKLDTVSLRHPSTKSRKIKSFEL